MLWFIPENRLISATSAVMIDVSTGNHSYFHQDGLGSVAALSDDNGTMTDVYTYGPYGETANTTGSPYRFTGRRLDSETGLYYYRARYYSPAQGRFLSPDPIGYGDGMNLYAYVGNDLVNFVDLSRSTSIHQFYRLNAINFVEYS